MAVRSRIVENNKIFNHFVSLSLCLSLSLRYFLSIEVNSTDQFSLDSETIENQARNTELCLGSIFAIKIKYYDNLKSTGEISAKLLRKV